MARTRRNAPDYLLLFLTLALIAFGMLMVFSASSMVSAYHRDGDSLFTVKKQIVAAVLGFAGMIFMMNLHYTKLRKLVFPLFASVIILLVLVLFIGNGKEEVGARSWIDFGPMNLQPSEFAKIALIWYLSALITNKGDKIRRFKGGLFPCLLVVGFTAGLIMLQPDFGSTAILVLGAAVVVLVGGARIRHALLLTGSAVAAGLLYVFLPAILHPGQTNYRLQRFETLRDPWSDTLDSTYQIVNSLYALGHGGWAGTGVGNSVQKLHFLTQADSDFIFSIIGEELGFVKTAVFVLLYAIFIWRGIVVSLRCKDKFASLAGVGIMSMIAIQALINIGGVTNSIPMTGVPLPLISYGGSSILATMIAMGYVLGISRDAVHKKRT